MTEHDKPEDEPAKHATEAEEFERKTFNIGLLIVCAVAFAMMVYGMLQ